MALMQAKIAQLELENAAASRCSFDECKEAATVYCASGCAELCVRHDSTSHSLLKVGHVRGQLSQKAALKRGEQTKEDAKLAAEIKSKFARVKEQAAELEQAPITSATISEFEQQLKEPLAQLNNARELVAELSRDLQTHTSALDSLKAVRASAGQLRQASQREAAAEWQVSLPQLLEKHGAVAVMETRLQELTSLSAEQHALAKQLPYFSSANLFSSKILDAALAADLKKLAGGVSLVNAALLYRATRDGFAASDFFSRCAEKGATLTLVKVKGNGFVFGLYSAVAWPQQIGSGSSVVADLSGASFLFSLVNAQQKAFRMSLFDKNRAIGSGTGVGLGGEAYHATGNLQAYCNAVLFLNGAQANCADGCCCNAPGYSKAAYQADAIGFDVDEDALAGEQYFVCVDIEVFAIGGAK